MDEPRYDIYLTGKLAEGVEPTAASRQLAALFKSTPEAMAALLTGKPQLLKRGVDKATALKYREALQRAGVLVAFKAQAPGEAAAAPAQPAASAARPATPPVAAPAQPAAAAVSPSTPTKQAPAITLAPAGGELLSPSERGESPRVNVDTSGYALAPMEALPQAPASTAIAPDTAHLSLAPTGSDVLTDAERERLELPAPDISDYSLAPAGVDLAVPAPAAPPAPDTGHISLAPVDAGPLAADRPLPPPAPDTSHLRLTDS